MGDVWFPKFTAALFTITKIQKQPVSMKRLMDRENVVYTCNGILFSLKKRRKSCRLWQHGWTKRTLCSVRQASHKSTNAAWFHLQKVSKLVKLIEAENTVAVARAWGVGKTRCCDSTRVILSYASLIVMLVPQTFAYVQTHQIIHIVYVQLSITS